MAERECIHRTIAQQRGCYPSKVRTISIRNMFGPGEDASAQQTRSGGAEEAHQVAIMKAAAFLAVILLLSGCTNSVAESERAFQKAEFRTPHSFRYRNEITTAAHRYSIPPALLLAIIHAESNFNPYAVSHKGAVGLMQLMPSTARWMAPGVSRKQLFNPATNIELGARYLRYLANRYNGDARKILVAWNAGPGRLDRGHIPRETEVFVRRVHSLYQLYAQA